MNPVLGKEYRLISGFHHDSFALYLGGVTGLLVVGIFSLAAHSGDSAFGAQAPAKKVREEEEEPEKSKVPAKINQVNPKDPPSSNRPPLPQGNFNIAQEAAKAKNPEIKEFLRRLSVPYDVLISSNGTETNIALQPERPSARWQIHLYASSMLT